MEPKSNWTRNVVLGLIYVTSLVILLWTLRDADFARLLDDVEHLNPFWISVGALAMVSVFFVQGLRWKLILAPVAKIPVLSAARAVFVGLFASEVTPVRAGELVRCYLVNRWTDLPFSVAVASVVLERLFDGILMWVALRYTLGELDVPRLALAADGLGVVVAIGIVVLGAALFRPKLRHTEMPSSGWRRRWFILQEDLAVIGHSWYLWAALAITGVSLLLQVVPVYILYREYDLNLGFGRALALMMLIRVAAAVPQAPASVGFFQGLTREFLELGFAVPADKAARFSLLLWALIKIPVLVSGAIATFITGAKISELTRAAGEAQSSSS